MVYLNDVLKGGGTRFPSINKTFLPIRGQAVLWNSLLPSGDPNPISMHAGLPVKEGEKIVITKWFRTRGIGPIFT